MIDKFFLSLSIDASKKEESILEEFFQSLDIECDSEQGLLVSIDGILCQENYSLPECIFSFLKERKATHGITSIICCYYFAHDGQCNLEFDKAFLKCALELFDSFGITTYESDI